MAVSTAVFAEQIADPYATGITLLSSEGCPVFVGAVVSGSPAEHAGVRDGDQLLAIGSVPVSNSGEAAKLLRSNQPMPVAATLKRNGKTFNATFTREKRSVIFARNGKKIVSGAIVSMDTTNAEVDRMIGFDGERIAARVFPTHYPENPEMFYAGFEIFLLRNPTQVAVGGIEDGPASRAGVRWGDVLVSVNGINTAGKTPLELKRLFLSTHPERMLLQIDRLGSVKFFDLKRAQDIARQNKKRFVNGQLVPIWVSDKYLHCFLN